MFNPSNRQLLILFLVLGIVRPALAQQQAQEQGVMSDARDAIVESEWGQKKKRQFDELKERLDDRFVQPVARWRAQLECSAGWRGDECEKMFPETRERVGRSLESLQDRAGSVARRARDLPDRLEDETVQARSGLKRLLETDEERADRVRNVRDLALLEARKEKERIDALNARNIAEQQQMARKFAEDQARMERERVASAERERNAQRERERAAEEERETLAQHETEVNQAVGMFLNILGAAAQGSRSQTYAPAQTYQAPSGQSQADFYARKRQYEQQQALQRQQQVQDELRARQRINSGGGSGGSIDYNACGKEVACR
jgi:hypothetical protein